MKFEPISFEPIVSDLDKLGLLMAGKCGDCGEGCGGGGTCGGCDAKGCGGGVETDPPV